MSEGKRMRRRTVWCLWMMLHKPKEAVQRTITAMREKKNGDDGKRTCWVREAENTHTITQAHTAHCVCWFVCVCVRETALQLTYRLHIKVNLYWTWCFALCRLEYRNAKANIGTASLIPPKNNKLWSLFWIFTSHAVFLRMQNTFFIMHRILKNIHDQKIPPHNYSSENVI